MPSHCEKIWFNGKIVNWNQATTHVMSHGLHYGSGIFEGVKCYITEDGPAIFKLNDHIDRFFTSAKIYRMELPFSNEDMLKGCLDIIKENELENGYIRPVAFYGYDTLGVHPKDCPVEVSIGAFDWGAYLGQDALVNGVRVTVSPWRKFHSSSFPTTAKANGQYLNSLLAVQDAKSKGFDEGLLLNQEGTIAEGAGQNIFLIKNGKLYTNAEDSSILMGITRETLIHLARDLGFRVKVGRLSVGQLLSADEAFFTGTASEVTPIRELDHRVVGSGGRGPITEKLQTAYMDVVHGRNPLYKSWLTYVNES
ncbi:MAG: branched-chain amino acid transaminase [Candidatus Marinimicrobia bacterium]|nr:branched-chain amino acid transaminase [Candidatus Neomarinimicrobiota bacterium]